MSEELFRKYIELGGGEALGDPLGPEQIITPQGYYRDFQHGSIYWIPAAGAHIVRGKILRFWRERRAQDGDLGYPISDEQMTPDRLTKYSVFQGGTISYQEQTDRCDVTINGKNAQYILRVVGTGAAIFAWIMIALVVALLSQNGFLGLATGLLGPLTSLLIILLFGKKVSAG